jgi:hypothetical protein
MTFDAMAAAVDWLDAYRAGEIEALLEMHADGSVVDCCCSGGPTITDRESLQVYWVKRLKSYPALDLNDINASSEGASLSYLSQDRVISSILEFNSTGRIIRSRCTVSYSGPASS